MSLRGRKKIIRDFVGARQKFAIVVKYERDLEKAKEIISKSEIGELLESEENHYLSEETKTLQIFDEEYYSYSLYDELLKIKQELTKAGYKTKVFYLNLEGIEGMDEI